MQRGLVCAENAFCESICRDDLCLYGILQKKYLLTCKKIMQIYFFWLYIFKLLTENIRPLLCILFTYT